MAERIETFQAAKASGNSGTACKVSGPYRSNRNSKIVIFVLAGTNFPTDSDGAATAWSLVSDAPATTRDAPAAE
jgi:hypothetical protein